jgi:hypothetical protein
MMRKIKARFGRNRIEFDIDDYTLALGLQLGWLEKFLGKWIFTDRGQEEFVAFINQYINERKAV